MASRSNERKILEFLRDAATVRDTDLTAHVISDRTGLSKETTEHICNVLRTRGWIGRPEDKFHCTITPEGVAQLKPWWRRRIVLIVAVVTVVVALVAAVFTVLLYLRGCEDNNAVVEGRGMTEARESMDSRLRGNDGGNKHIMEELWQRH